MLRTLALSAALCAALTPVGAQAALRLSTDGAGSAVYVPYYSVEDGQTSLVTVSNHGSEPVAARVTFTESQNGQEVLYFLVFLPPLSSWSSAVAASGDGAAASWSAEGVCTVPAAPGEVPFRNFAYADIFPDAGSSGLERTRTGAIEVLEIGTLSGALAEATLAGECATLIAAYSDNPPFDRAPLFGAPAESLSASAQLVEVESGIIHAVPGIAVKGFSDRSLDPAAGGFEIGLRFSRPVLPEGASEFLVETSAGGLAFPADRGADAISSLFMAESLSGEVHQQSGLNASTQWVLSFPTKHEYVADIGGSLFREAGAETAVAPFTEAFGAEGACETVALARNDFTGVALADATGRALCFEQSLLSFEATDSGVAQLRFDTLPARSISATRVADDVAVSLRGLPVIGLRMSRFQNGELAGGLLANYTVALPLVARPSSAFSASDR